jgi:AraC family transcriptional regulator
MVFAYPPERSQFTLVTGNPPDAPTGVSLARIRTSPGYNHNSVDKHTIGLHLGEPVSIVHQRSGKEWYHRFHPGDVIFTPAGPDVHYAHPTTVDGLYIAIGPEHITQLAADIGLEEVQLVEDLGTSDPVLHRIGGDLLREMETPGLGGRLYIETLVTQVMLHLLRHYGHSRTVPPMSDASSEHQLVQRLRPAVEYIDAHLSENLSLSDLAATVHLAPYYFSRLFRQAYGVSPYQYVIRRRVGKARHLLNNPRLTVAEVAVMVGFADHSHLIRHYKRLLGRTPRA